jgi:DNA/RNA-binding domain of Phe-tRNA-synthetase-like protein
MIPIMDWKGRGVEGLARTRGPGYARAIMTMPSLAFDEALDPLPLRAALIWGLGLPGCPASEGPAPELSALLERVRAAGEAWLPEGRRKAVRDMLRHGSYKPAGRAKPSSEYLLAAALDGSFPFVNGAVDACNAASLESGYPASVFDLGKTGPELILSRGRADESYVFNPSGQEIGLEDLLLVRRRLPDGGLEPCGNPVKDAMATKVFAGCRDVVGVVYAPATGAPKALEACAARFAFLLGAFAGAAETGWSIL